MEKNYADYSPHSPGIKHFCRAIKKYFVRPKCPRKNPYSILFPHGRPFQILSEKYGVKRLDNKPDFSFFGPLPIARAVRKPAEHVLYYDVARILSNSATIRSWEG